MGELTPWFKSGTKPRRAGVYRIRYYEVTWIGRRFKVEGYAYWSRRLGWRQFDHTVRDARRRNHYPLCHGDVQPEWRGRLHAPTEG